MLGENIENELGAVDHLVAHDLLDIPDLARREPAVDDERSRAAVVHDFFDFFELSRPQKS
jgi:hypothetical protein